MRHNIFENTIRSIYWNLKGGYRPERFWDNWAEDFIKDSWQKNIHRQHAWLLKKVKDINPESILEIGCGFGRNIKFLLNEGIDPKKILGLDISRKMLRNARKHIGNKDVSLIHSDVKQLPFKDSSFDLVLVHGVLMHVEPQKIEKVIREIKRVAGKHILLVEQNYGGNKFTFVHNYKKLLKEVRLNIAEYQRDKISGLDYFWMSLTNK